MIVSGPRRRLALATAILCDAAGVLSACGDGSSSGGEKPSASGAGGTAAAEGFPATVDTSYGKITVEHKPKRIVALRGNYLDLLDSIGEKPVAFAASPRVGVSLLKGYPWFKGKDTSAHNTKIVSSGYEVRAEAVAALKPDLILGATYNIDNKLYRQLSQIAPTYVGTAKPPAITPWEDDLKSIGTLTGKSAQARKALKKVDGEFAAARKRLPGLQGKTYLHAFYLDGGFRDGAQADYPFLDDLGLKGDKNPPTTLSMENLEDLDSDVVAIISFVDPAGERTIKADPRYPALPAAKNKAVLFHDATRANATAEGGPAATSWLPDQLVPQLEKSPLNTTR